MVGQMLDCDHRNLGFSGSCKGEQAMADYLASLPMSAFVCGYDHNAPTLAHLQKTHLPLVQAVRQAHPHIPIVLLNRPKAVLNSEEQARLDVIRATCDAVDGTLITGDRLIPPEITSWATVDGVHPNDLGFYHMAKAVASALLHKAKEPSL
jgi:lysophospholipase L1-like esterase